MVGEIYNKPENLISRELSWLEFDQRVLDEAVDPENPLMERGKFLSITSSNLDEFFMVRVGSLKDAIHSEITKPDPAGLTPKQQMKRIAVRTSRSFINLSCRSRCSSFSRTYSLSRLAAKSSSTPGVLSIFPVIYPAACMLCRVT